MVGLGVRDDGGGGQVVDDVGWDFGKGNVREQLQVCFPFVLEVGHPGPVFISGSTGARTPFGRCGFEEFGEVFFGRCRCVGDVVRLVGGGWVDCWTEGRVSGAWCGCLHRWRVQWKVGSV